MNIRHLFKTCIVLCGLLSGCLLGAVTSIDVFDKRDLVLPLGGDLAQSNYSHYWDIQARVTGSSASSNLTWNITGLPVGISATDLDKNRVRLVGQLQQVGEYIVTATLSAGAISDTETFVISVRAYGLKANGLKGDDNSDWITMYEGERLIDSLFGWEGWISPSSLNHPGSEHREWSVVDLPITWNLTNVPPGMWFGTFAENPIQYDWAGPNLTHYLYSTGKASEPGEYSIKITTSTSFESSQAEMKIRVLSKAPDIYLDYFPDYIRQSSSAVEYEYIEVSDYHFSHPRSNSYDVDLEKASYSVVGLGHELEIVETEYGVKILGPWPEAGTYIFKVVASNSFGTSELPLEVTVLPSAPLATDLLDVLYFKGYEHDYKRLNFSIPEFAATSFDYQGELPAGMEIEFNQAGSVLVKGFPYEFGDFPITITVTNEFGELIQPITIRVTPGNIFNVDTIQSGSHLYSHWLGFFWAGGYPWIYHFELGWMYVWEGSEHQYDIWFYHYGPPSKGWMYSGRDLDGFFYYEVTPGVWSWQWLYTGTFDPDAPGDGPPANP
ncbi:hypothetical protein [Rubellicoccus peritrichatus]|uniref:Uncharacterized protein n=1 Tax=Rubellicoccus peritrichatus TaxID=3080537 RepID=A0AAQ3QRW7_9BACT|nr:hypothetical protein [Puniceicoccus sp. CR14]WOO41723.1 hypothetical protein RZN69_01385 [Puniceicoccus sp. CR14]